MLTPLNPREKPPLPAVPIGEAAFPSPFQPGLEFNPPVHGTWNIVHIGMLLPEAQQIYVCAVNCMRGVVLTAAEMNASERFSFVLLEERDLLTGQVEEVTIEGVTDVLHKLPALPPAVLLFTVCVHHFLGCDLNRIYRELGRRFPSVTFLRCCMDPIMQKGGLSPDQKLRKAMYDPLQPLPVRRGAVALLGGNFPLEEDCDLKRLLSAGGVTLKELPGCASYGEYLSMGEAELYLAVAPNGRYGAEQTAKRLGRPFLYLPATFDFAGLRRELTALAEALGLPLPDLGVEEARTEEALGRAHALIGSTPIAIDCTVHPRPLGLALLLLEHGFSVDTVYLDGVSREEEGAFRTLQERYPTLTLKATIQPAMRVLPRGTRPNALAVGQKAAWFEGTGHFVNLVEGGGLWGFQGIRSMAALLEDAFRTEKDTRDLVPRKGLGCESCL